MPEEKVYAFWCLKPEPSDVIGSSQAMIDHKGNLYLFDGWLNEWGINIVSVL